MEFKRLGDIIIIEKGKKPSITDEPDENAVRVLQIDDLRNDNDIKFTNDKSGVLASKHDVLIAWDGANAGTIGFGKEGYIGSTIAVLRIIDPANFNSVYVGKFLQGQFNFLKAKSTGATIPHVDRKSLLNLKIPVLPIEEQIRIASILEKTEELISKRKESTVFIDELTKNTFLKMIGDPAKNEKGWENGKFRDIAIIDRNQLEPNQFEDYDYFIGLEDIEKQTGIINKTSTEDLLSLKSSKFLFTPNHILYGKLRPYLNKVAMPSKTGLCSTDIFPILPINNISNKEFICYFMRTNYFVNEMTKKSIGANLPRANPKSLQDLKTFIPPIELQNHFAEIVNRVEGLKTSYNESLNELQNLYYSLSQKAFKGELNLSKIDVSEELKMHEVKVKMLRQEFEDETVEVKQLEGSTSPTSILKQIVSKRFRNLEFTFEELFNVAIDNQDEILEYEELKDLVYNALNNQLDIKLVQKFDVNKKRMLLSESK